MQEYPAPPGSDRKEILIYSGMTMIKPLLEVSKLFEQQENCVVKITYGGSGHIMRSVQINKIGDLFFPGNKLYIDELAEQEMIEETALVGYNQAALFVQPGNPKQITPDLHNLTDARFNVVIGSETSGAIGRETKRILDNFGIYQQVIDNALYLTTDSKGLNRAMRSHDADLVMNWKAVGYFPENKGKMEILPHPEEPLHRRPLVIGTLRYSQNPKLAGKFLRLISSETGQQIFQKFGFLD
ncbi:substrate-binding domain-containing protein [Malonomonas rubra]|nr:substrate-binding domain-containing protein [Malonomonas rubra]